MKILIVDDKTPIREFLKKGITKLTRFSVEVAQDGAEAMRKIEVVRRFDASFSSCHPVFCRPFEGDIGDGRYPGDCRGKGNGCHGLWRTLRNRGRRLLASAAAGFDIAAGPVLVAVPAASYVSFMIWVLLLGAAGVAFLNRRRLFCVGKQ